MIAKGGQMKQEIVIRKMEFKDFAQWHSLRLQLWDDCEEAESRDFFNKKLPSQEVFLAENEQKAVVGFIETNVRNYAEGCDTDNVGFIEGWFVLPEYRQQNIGKMLVKTAENWAKEQGCTEMASDALINNTLSIEAHKKLGYEEVERIVCFRKNL